jgi:hypothetical protein
MSRRPLPELLVLAGWSLVVIFGVIVWLAADEPASGALFAGVGLIMVTWVAQRPGTAALAVSLVLGLLHTLEEVAYLSAGLSERSIWVVGIVGDAEGLLAGLLIVGGAGVALVRRRRARATAQRLA